MSSHREAPEIAKDPVADSTDVYAFVSPDNPSTVTLIANYVPLQAPDGGPNFYEFGSDVLYELHIDTDGDAKPNITYQFRFTTVNTNPGTFLYNTGQLTINSAGRLNLAAWNRRQYYTVTKVVNGTSTTLASNLTCPPCNVGVLSTPGYSATASDGGPEPFTKAFVHMLPNGEQVFAGQRAEGFFVDLGAIFDLGQIRPISAAHFGGISGMPSVNSTSAVNVHSIAIQIPKSVIYAVSGTPKKYSDQNATIGVYTSASRQHVRTYEASAGVDGYSGSFVQVSRMANPLFNEVLVPLSKKDQWNATYPYQDSAFAAGVTNPELAQLLPVLYPGAFPNLAALNADIAAGKKSRADLAAILLTGIPGGLIPGFQNNTTTVPADLLRLNTVIAPTQKNGTDTSGTFSNLGLAGGDPSGFPNGRRVVDDVATVELKAVAGLLYPLVDSSYTPDGAVGLVDQYLTNDGQDPSNPNAKNDGKDVTAKGSVRFLTSFPYLGTPHGGYQVPATTPPNELSTASTNGKTR